MSTAVVRTIEWHTGDERPDANIDVLVELPSGEQVIASWDDELEEWVSPFAHGFEAIAWAELPEGSR